MGNNKGLTTKNHDEMDAFLGRVLDAYKSGEITKDSAVGGLGHVMSALHKSNTGEAVAWFNQDGVKFFKDSDKFYNKG